MFKHETGRLLYSLRQPWFWYLTILGNGIMLTAVGLFYYFEFGINPNLHSFLDSLWWGVSTITSVGYGDIVPITAYGKIVGIILMYTGTILFVAFTGFLVSTWLSQSMQHEMVPLEKEVVLEEKAIARIEERLRAIEKHLSE